MLRLPWKQSVGEATASTSEATLEHLKPLVTQEAGLKRPQESVWVIYQLGSEAVSDGKLRSDSLSHKGKVLALITN